MRNFINIVTWCSRLSLSAINSMARRSLPAVKVSNQLSRVWAQNRRGTCALMIGEHHHSVQQSYGALFIAAAAVALGEKKQVEKEKLILLIKFAKLAEMKSNFEEAEHYYHEALRIVEKMNSKDGKDKLQMLIYLYDHMANLALARGELDAAENLFKETMRGLLEQGHEKQGPAIVEISLKLAMIYAMQGRDKDAENGYAFCISSQEENVKHLGNEESEKDAVALLGMCVNSYARYLMLKDKLQEAVLQMEKAIDLAGQSLGKQDPQVAVLQSDLAHIQSAAGSHAEAYKHIKDALTLAEDLDLDDLHDYYINFGTVVYNMGKPEEAKKHFRKGLKLASAKNNVEAKKRAETWIKKCSTFSQA